MDTKDWTIILLLWFTVLVHQCVGYKIIGLLYIFVKNMYLKIVYLYFQIELLSPKQNGNGIESDRESTSSKNKQSIKGMWKKAFKSLKTKDKDRGERDKDREEKVEEPRRSSRSVSHEQIYTGCFLLVDLNILVWCFDYCQIFDVVINISSPSIHIIIIDTPCCKIPLDLYVFFGNQKGWQCEVFTFICKGLCLTTNLVWHAHQSFLIIPFSPEMFYIQKCKSHVNFHITKLATVTFPSLFPKLPSQVQ